jgi:dTDP-4-dehydrorhamnose reductase
MSPPPAPSGRPGTAGATGPTGPIGPPPRRGRGTRSVAARGARAVTGAATAVAGAASGRRRVRRLLFVTGGTGFLGRHVVTTSAAETWEIVAPDRFGLDLRNAASVRDVITDWRPTAIIHTAYRKNDRASTVDATRHVAEAAAEVGARMVHVSSDVVFRGGVSPFTETDRISPMHEYGRQKADAELIVSSTCPDSVIVRTSLLIGRRVLSGHEQAVWEAIEGRSPITFFVDEIRCPALVDDVAAGLVLLAGRPEINGVLHLAGRDAISRADLARLIARRHRWDASKLRFGSLEASGLDRPAKVILDSSLAASYGLAVRGADW